MRLHLQRSMRLIRDSIILLIFEYIFKYGTPSFIFLSDFVLFYNYADRPLTKDLIKTSTNGGSCTFSLPYVLFSIIYFFVRMYQNGLLNSSFDLWAQMPVFFERLIRGRTIRTYTLCLLACSSIFCFRYSSSCSNRPGFSYGGRFPSGSCFNGALSAYV